MLSFNPSAIELLSTNQHRINWFNLSKNPAAIELLKANLEKVDWNLLSGNPGAMELLEANQDKIDWYTLSCNPSIFVYDYESMKRPFAEELMANRFHPNNIERFESWGYE